MLYSKDIERGYPEKGTQNIKEDSISVLEKITQCRGELDDDLRCSNTQNEAKDSSGITEMKLSSNKDTTTTSCHAPSIDIALGSGSRDKKKLPCWMSAGSSDVKMTSAVRTNEIDAVFHDSLDDFVFEEKKIQSGKRNDCREENWKNKIRNKERRRGQSLDDAADELKRIVELNF